MPKNTENVTSVEDFGGRLFATLTETARLLGCDTSTLRRAIAAGQIPVTQLGKSERVPVSWLRRLAAGEAEIPEPSAEPETRRSIWEQAKQDVLRAAVFGHYGTVCACCGGTDQLQIDHVNGDGKAHREELKGLGTYRFYSWLIDNGFPAGYQTLCGPCNSSKGTGTACRIDHELHSAVLASAPAS